MHRPSAPPNSEFSTICTIQYHATAVAVCEYPLSFFALLQRRYDVHTEVGEVIRNLPLALVARNLGAARARLLSCDCREHEKSCNEGEANAA